MAEFEYTESLPIALAVQQLVPGCVWSMIGNDYDNLIWDDDINKKPTKEAVIQKAKQIKAGVPMKVLRRQRDARLREVDWVTLKSVRTGEPVPQEWKEYMQALADITKTAKPLYSQGILSGVDWPKRPDGIPAGLPPGEVYEYTKS